MESLIAIPVNYYFISFIIGISVYFWKRRMDLSLLCAYLFIILSTTVLKRNTDQTRGFQLLPFWSYFALLGKTKSPVAIKTLILQIIGNIVAFIPIGVLAGSYMGKKGVIIGVAFSMTIELLQLAFYKGLFEIDDIIHNSIGTVLGIVLLNLINKALGNLRTIKCKKH